MDTCVVSVQHLAYAPWSGRIPCRDTVLNIILASRQYELKEINVSAEKPPFRISGGNIVANIPSLPGHESASIGKMLERLPGVTSSPEGGYRLNGSEAIVYIDGIK